jgi:hypothetical protein
LLVSLVPLSIQKYNSQKLMTNLSEELKSHQYEMILNPKMIIKEFELNSCDMQKVSIAAGGDVKEKIIICLFGEFKVDRFAQIHSK